MPESSEKLPPPETMENGLLGFEIFPVSVLLESDVFEIVKDAVLGGYPIVSVRKLTLPNIPPIAIRGNGVGFTEVPKRVNLIRLFGLAALLLIMMESVRNCATVSGEKFTVTITDIPVSSENGEPPEAME